MMMATLLMYGTWALVGICGLLGIALSLVWIFTLFGFLLPLPVNVLIAATMFGCFWVVWQLAPAVDAFKAQQAGPQANQQAGVPGILSR